MDDRKLSSGHRRKDSNAVTAKDLTKYAYGVAKGMEFLGSKGVRFITHPAYSLDDYSL